MATARAQALSDPIGSAGLRPRTKPGAGPSAYPRRPADEEAHLAWLARQASDALFSPTSRFYWAIAGGLLLLEAALMALIIRRVPYTEIDFSTYLEQARVFLKGERQYSRITGASGPCVYPALHLYLHIPLDALTSQGSNLIPAQWVYAALYLATQALVFDLYRLASVPPAVLPLLVISKRLHSLYPLRMFNDCWTMFFLYASFSCLIRRRWNAASMLFSAALGIKMSALLVAPAFGVVYLRSLGFSRAFTQGLLVLLIQVLLSLPFTLHHPLAYLSGAFDFSRAFLYEWTVNLRFLSESAFLAPRTARVLLGAHALGTMAWMGRWLNVPGRDSEEKMRTLLRGGETLSARFMLLALCTSNLLGIAFSRSLHYQFYAWYAHQLPLLLYFVRLPWLLRVAIYAGIECAWLTFPSTPLSSGMLAFSHALLLLGLWFTPLNPALPASPPPSAPHSAAASYSNETKNKSH